MWSIKRQRHKDRDALCVMRDGYKLHPSRVTSYALRLFRKTHQTIKKVTNSIERDYHFNTAIASIMELINEMLAFSPSSDEDRNLLRLTTGQAILLLSPFAPHFSEELWREIGEKQSVINEKWPSWDEGIAKEDEVELVVQINGKVRAKIMIPAGLDEESIKEKAFGEPKIQEHINGKTPKKVIVVKGRLVNIVI